MEKFSEIKYVRPDVKKYRAAMRGLISKLKNAETFESADGIFNSVISTMSEYDTMSTVAYIRHDCNTADEFYEKEMKFLNRAEAGNGMVLKSAIKTLLASRFMPEFEKKYGAFTFKSFETQIKLVKPAVLLDIVEEGNLKQKYSKIAASCTIEFGGEKCNFYGLLKHMQNPDRAVRRDAFCAWAKLYEDASAELDRVYDELVALRVRMAKKLKFENYTKMAYYQRRRFDYTEADAAAFRKQVLETVVPACAKLYEEQRVRLGVDKLCYYDEQLTFPEGNALPIGDREYLVDAASRMYHELSAETGEYFDFMCEHELFDLQTAPGKRLGGYCTFLETYKAPFIFSNFNGTSADVDVLTHEAGHAFQAYVASRALPLICMSSTSEINEIHSMTMEHFAYPWMEKFFGENAEKYKYAHLTSALTTIPYLVAVDEFQHRVYEKPEMNAAERREVWREIERKYMPWRDYDGNKFLEDGGFWMQKQHIFLYPFYYIEYALAQVCAFQLYGRMKTDRTAAWNDYYRLCLAGGSMGYFDLLKYSNMRSPFEPGTVADVVDIVISEAEKHSF